MTVQQTLIRRYVDKEKLGIFWRTHPDFKDKACSLIVSRPVKVNSRAQALTSYSQIESKSYVVNVPREMIEVCEGRRRDNSNICSDWVQEEVKSVYYDQATLDQMEADAEWE
jgi:hypothetical protein